MKPLTTSVYTFGKLIEGGFLYVDKTAGILELLRPAFGQYFLARPRRFGKSLLISTLKAVFQGRRDLFAGLALDRSDYNWTTCPVIHLDLGTTAAQTVEELERMLGYAVDDNATSLGVTLSREGCAARFQELVLALAARHGKVAILIDEYDKPLLGHLGRPSARDFQRVLKAFYGVVKGTEAQQRFVLITGVSKYSIEAEARTGAGRIDAVVKTKTDIFVFEFTLRETAEAALRQIRKKRYFDRFLDDGRRITLIGVAFAPDERNLDRWLTEPAR
jgi:hypothetical protein